jgi:hypothetical protein
MQLLNVDVDGITFQLFPDEAATIAGELLEVAYQHPEGENQTLRLLASTLDAMSRAGEMAQQLAEAEMRLKASRGVVAHAAAHLHLSAETERQLETLARLYFLEEQSDRARAGNWKGFQAAHPTMERAMEQYRAVWEQMTGETSEEANHLLTPGQITLLWEHGETEEEVTRAK